MMGWASIPGPCSCALQAHAMLPTQRGRPAHSLPRPGTPPGGLTPPPSHLPHLVHHELDKRVACEGVFHQHARHLLGSSRPVQALRRLRHGCRRGTDAQSCSGGGFPFPRRGSWVRQALVSKGISLGQGSRVPSFREGPETVGKQWQRGHSTWSAGKTVQMKWEGGMQCPRKTHRKSMHRFASMKGCVCVGGEGGPPIMLPCTGQSDHHRPGSRPGPGSHSPRTPASRSRPQAFPAGTRTTDRSSPKTRRERRQRLLGHRPVAAARRRGAARRSRAVAHVRHPDVLRDGWPRRCRGTRQYAGRAQPSEAGQDGGGSQGLPWAQHPERRRSGAEREEQQGAGAHQGRTQARLRAQAPAHGDQVRGSRRDGREEQRQRDLVQQTRGLCAAGGRGHHSGDGQRRHHPHPSQQSQLRHLRVKKGWGVLTRATRLCPRSRRALRRRPLPGQAFRGVAAPPGTGIAAHGVLRFHR